MSTVARRIRATPERSATGAWRVIEDLISTAGSDARKELDRVAGVAASLIAEETPKDHPIVVAGSGPRLRMYCLYGEDAITGDGSDENTLSWDPTAGDWRMSLPAAADDIKWVKAELAKHSKRITAYNLEKEKPGDEVETEGRSASLSVDHEAFNRL
jgi:hypothetical protein